MRLELISDDALEMGMSQQEFEDLQRRRSEADDKSCSLCDVTDFEKISASSRVPQHNDAVRLNSSLSASENPQVYDDEDTYADTEPDFDDDQELSDLAQRQPSAFHAAMSREVCYDFFFLGSNLSQLP